MIFLFLKETNMGFLRKVNSAQPCLCWRRSTTRSSRAGRGRAGAAMSFLQAVHTASFDQSCSSAVTRSEKSAGSLCRPPSLRLCALSPCVPTQQPLGNFTCPHLPDLPHLPTFQAITLAWRPSSPLLSSSPTCNITSPYSLPELHKQQPCLCHLTREEISKGVLFLLSCNRGFHTHPWGRLLIIWLTLWVSTALSKPQIPQSTIQDPLSFLKGAQT